MWYAEIAAAAEVETIWGILRCMRLQRTIVIVAQSEGAGPETTFPVTLRTACQQSFAKWLWWPHT